MSPSQLKNFGPENLAITLTCASIHSNGLRKLINIMVFVLAGSLIMPSANAQCCSIGNWEATARAFLDSNDNPGVPAMLSNSQAISPVVGPPTLENRRDSYPNGKILLSLKSVASSDVVVDVSNGDDYNESHIQNAIHLPAKNFLNANGSIKLYDELAKVLGDAGISEYDPLVVYGSSESSGELELAFWVLSYLGHKNAKVLDGSLKDWSASGLPMESLEHRKNAVAYRSDIKPGLLAEYGYVKSGQAQILDTRPFPELAKGRIPGAVALETANVLDRDRIKRGEDLRAVFERLNKASPVVVYSDDYTSAPLLWFALTLMGFNASIYAWNDWKTHEIKNSSMLSEPLKEALKPPQYYKKLGRT